MKGIESIWNDNWSIRKPTYFIIWFSFNINFRFAIKWCSRAHKVILRKYVKYTCSMETVQQNGRFTLFSSKFHSSIYSILFAYTRPNHLLSVIGFQHVIAFWKPNRLANFSKEFFWIDTFKREFVHFRFFLNIHLGFAFIFAHLNYNLLQFVHFFESHDRYFIGRLKANELLVEWWILYTNLLNMSRSLYFFSSSQRSLYTSSPVSAGWLSCLCREPLVPQIPKWMVGRYSRLS